MLLDTNDSLYMVMHSVIYINIYYIYNTARCFPRFQLDFLVVYIFHIHGFFFYIHGSRMEPRLIDKFDLL